MTVLIVAFIVGLIPVAGNLISNTIIIILSLGAFALRRTRIAGFPRCHPQARIFPQRQNHRLGNRIQRMGIAGGDGVLVDIVYLSSRNAWLPLCRKV